jgi:hypothetical protein
LHGHFRASKKLVETYPEARLIAWVRDPVDRLVSYFHFWKDLKPQGNPNHDRFLAERMSLVEFARSDFMRGEFLSYFGDCDLDDFLFVGFVDRYAEDLRILGSLFGWPDLQVHRDNVGPPKRPVGDAELRELREVLSEEIDFHRRLKAWRGRKDARSGPL